MFHKNQPKTSKSSIRKLLILSVAALLTVCVTVFGGTYLWYNSNIKPLDPNSTTTSSFIIEPGQSSAVIASNLNASGFIKNETAFSWYLRLNNKANSLQAGDYKLSPSYSTERIVEELSSGKVESRNITLLPGKRLDQLKKILIEAGYTEAEIDNAYDPINYLSHPIAKFKPDSSSLEGYIYPETFQITENTTAVALITKALDETYRKLTPEIVEGLERQGLSVHDAVILASIVEKEVARPSDRPLVAQVFLKRLREGIELGSDVTYIYASVVFGGRAAPDLDHPYNTRIYAGLPPGPVSNFDISSIEAIVNPSDTEYLFFVSGDDGTTHYAKTFAEHNQNIANFCSFNCLLPDQRDDIIDL